MACCITHVSGGLWFSDDCSCPLNVVENAGANVLWCWDPQLLRTLLGAAFCIIVAVRVGYQHCVINSCSSLGGFLINKSLGFVSTHYGATGIFIVEAILCFAAVAVLALMKIDVKKEKKTNKQMLYYEPDKWRNYENYVY